MSDTSKATVWALIEELAAVPAEFKHEQDAIDDARAALRALLAERDALVAERAREEVLRNRWTVCDAQTGKCQYSDDQGATWQEYGQ